MKVLIFFYYYYLDTIQYIYIRYNTLDIRYNDTIDTIFIIKTI